MAVSEKLFSSHWTKWRGDKEAEGRCEVAAAEEQNETITGYVLGEQQRDGCGAKGWCGFRGLVRVWIEDGRIAWIAWLAWMGLGLSFWEDGQLQLQYSSVALESPPGIRLGEVASELTAMRSVGDREMEKC